MSRAGMLQGALDALFTDASNGSFAAAVQMAVLRQLLEKGVFDRSDIVAILQRLETRAAETGEDDAWMASDFRAARDELLAGLNREPGLDIAITEPTFEDKLADPGATTKIE